MVHGMECPKPPPVDAGGGFLGFGDSGVKSIQEARPTRRRSHSSPHSVPSVTAGGVRTRSKPRRPLSTTTAGSEGPSRKKTKVSRVSSEVMKPAGVMDVRHGAIPSGRRHRRG